MFGVWTYVGKLIKTSNRKACFSTTNNRDSRSKVLQCTHTHGCCSLQLYTLVSTRCVHCHPSSYVEHIHVMVIANKHGCTRSGSSLGYNRTIWGRRLRPCAGQGKRNNLPTTLEVYVYNQRLLVRDTEMYAGHMICACTLGPYYEARRHHQARKVVSAAES